MEYEIVIGLEVHAELSTQSKIFCSCTTEFGGEPNTHCCPVCLGMPGTLPVLNSKAVEYAIKAGLALNCEIAEYSELDRKNYFYPDLPKAYQISQLYHPLCTGGYVDIESGDTFKRIGIREIHIEEDAGKLIHDCDDGTLVDYNRCGIPLIEIVSEPDMRSPEEAKVFLENLKAVLQYIGVSDCKMQEGSLRADVNLSVRLKGEDELGTRTEMKNLNSFRAVVRAIEAESLRQIAELGAERVIIQETRRWDDVEGVSYAMRNKEEAHDYRYFPEPDIIPLFIDRAWVKDIKASLPELPSERQKRYILSYALPKYDAYILTRSKAMADFFEEAVKESSNAKSVGNWMMGDMTRLLREMKMEIDDVPFNGKHLARLVTLIDEGIINGTMAKAVFEKMFDTGRSPDIIVREEGLEIINDEKALDEVIDKVIKNNSQSVVDYKNGKDKALGYLVGQVMKETKGKAEPQLVNKMLRQFLDK